jgi:class 3 adenylate cyclase
MHRTLKRLLADAAGESQWVVAINLDIRGFSSRMSANPSETALYLKKVYARILDSYFTNLSFFKPTGDGLLVVIPFEEAALREVAEAVIKDCLDLVDAFPLLVADDPLVTFPHPDHVGIGVSVGSVARLVTRRTTLDYTGRPLNVATRLMDLARPTGVVADAALPIAGTKLAARFAPDKVFLKGVAELQPLDILFTQAITEIPESYRKPITPDEWFVEEETVTLAEAKRRTGGKFRTILKHEPTNRQRIDVRVVYPDYKNGRPVEGIARHWKLSPPAFDYVLERGSRPVVSIDYEKLIKRFSELKMPGRTSFVVEIGYPIRSAPKQPDVGLSELLATFLKQPPPS